jgi:hypothetical protein
MLRAISCHRHASRHLSLPLIFALISTFFAPPFTLAYATCFHNFISPPFASAFRL